MNDISQLPQHQNTADCLKGIALGIPSPALRPLRTRVLNMIRIFERVGFHQQGFIQAFDEVSPPLLIQNKRITRLPDAEDRAVLEGIEALLERHLAFADPVPRDVYTSETAADYLGITKDGVNYHQKKGHLVGRLLGHTRIYTKDELDHFNAHRKSAGRPVERVEN